ncbi:hypothetical protein EW146_g5399 [Bondarzewia mesenterica]|uniref:Uncharacterized protein n=1 Tax=Bondarzewia mesenterica TaxID=1095465 RepID=A0A4S4LTR2_9AGAM|nr:hypothetical protein EW146_g5399 [Bondarzewia mesenterica]
MDLQRVFSSPTLPMQALHGATSDSLPSTEAPPTPKDEEYSLPSSKSLDTRAYANGSDRAQVVDSGTADDVSFEMRLDSLHFDSLSFDPDTFDVQNL